MSRGTTNPGRRTRKLSARGRGPGRRQAGPAVHQPEGSRGSAVLSRRPVRPRDARDRVRGSSTHRPSRGADRFNRLVGNHIRPRGWRPGPGCRAAERRPVDGGSRPALPGMSAIPAGSTAPPARAAAARTRRPTGAAAREPQGWRGRTGPARRSRARPAGRRRWPAGAEGSPTAATVYGPKLRVAPAIGTSTPDRELELEGIFGEPGDTDRDQERPEFGTFAKASGRKWKVAWRTIVRTAARRPLRTASQTALAARSQVGTPCRVARMYPPLGALRPRMPTASRTVRAT